MAKEPMSLENPNRVEKDSTPASTYPHNYTYQFAGGARLVVGNEAGKESFKMYHPSGTYMEVQPDGKMVSMTIAEEKKTNKGGVTLTFDENGDVHMTGHSKMTIGGGTHLEVQGDAGIMVGGKTSITSLGDLGLAVNGNMYLGAKGNISMNAMGSTNIQTQGTTYIGSGSGLTVQASTVSLNPQDGASGYVS